ncbi:MAG: hypothetical protein WDM79_14680 [Terricaulis sp.]
MITGRRSTDWLRAAPASEGGEGDRRDCDRRASDRRAPRRRIDPLFAATLINQVTPSSSTVPAAYRAAPPALRRGVVVNCKA